MQLFNDKVGGKLGPEAGGGGVYTGSAVEIGGFTPQIGGWKDVGHVPPSNCPHFHALEMKNHGNDHSGVVR